MGKYHEVTILYNKFPVMFLKSTNAHRNIHTQTQGMGEKVWEVNTCKYIFVCIYVSITVLKAYSSRKKERKNEISISAIRPLHPGRL